MSLLPALQVGLSAVKGAPTILGGPSAQAQPKFDGKIKRIRIKKRRTGSGFRVFSRTAGDSPDAIGSLVTSASVALGGELIPVETTPATRRKGVQVAASRIIGVPEIGSPVVLTVLLTDDGSVNWDDLGGFVPEVSFVLESVGSDAAVALGENGWKARARINGDGVLKVVISNESGAWNGHGLAGIIDQTEGSDIGGELAVDEYRQTWTQELMGDESLLEQAVSLGHCARLRPAIDWRSRYRDVGKAQLTAHPSTVGVLT